MKLTNILLSISLILLLTACKTKQATQAERTNIEPQTSELDQKAPIMTFDRVLHDFGKVVKGEKRETTFHFTNTGNTDLEIEIATSCHCATLDYSTDPVPPNGTGQIDLIFDSSEKDESELIDITIILKNVNPENGYPIVEEVKYKYELVVN